MDPTGLKPELAKYANRTLSQLLQSSSLKNRIMIGKHNIGADQPGALYRDERTGRYDGLHMYARKGYHVYTESVLHILRSCLNQNSRDSSSPSSSSHRTQNQAMYQEQQRAKLSGKNTAYNVPVSNHFDVLGN